MKKYLLLVLVITLLTIFGCAQSPTFSNDQFSVNYPNGYTLEEDNQGIVTISNDKGKIMIGDFEPAASANPLPDMTQEQIDEFPKDIKYHGYEGEIASALFYTTGDDTEMALLKEIQDSIELK
jgi:hypothetical protein